MNADYDLTRSDQGGSREIRIEEGPDGWHVYADQNTPDWVIDARVQAALMPQLIERYQAEQADDSATARLLDQDFLGAADETAILDAIVEAASTDAGADLVDLQTVDPDTGNLEIVAAQGFSAEFVETFRTVNPGDPTSCALALATGTPVLVDDITRSAIYLGQPSLDPMRDAGSRAVASYPLLDEDGLVRGVLSFHYRRPGIRNDAAKAVACAAAKALRRR